MKKQKQEEIWKDVVGFEEYFMISSFGRVWSKRTEKILKQGINDSGYPVISTRIGGRKGKAICKRVHRWVAEAFIDNPEDKLYVNHIDLDVKNPHKDNLEWCTHQENIHHFCLSEKFKNKHKESIGKQRILDYENLLEDFLKSGLSIRKYAKKIGYSYSGVQHALKYLETGKYYGERKYV